MKNRLASTAVPAAQRVARCAYRKAVSLLPLRARRHVIYTIRMRRLLNLRNPLTFGEKIQWRILHDRDSWIVQCCDKLAMKELARQIVPDETELRIATTLWYGRNLVDAPVLHKDLQWVVKPNHSSGHALFGSGDPRGRADETRGWLRSKPAVELGEWGYSQARPLLLLEEKIPSASVDESLTDYKFFVYDGVPHFIQVNSNRFGGDHSISYYDTEWNKFPVKWSGHSAKDEVRPTELDQMLGLASRLGQRRDFIRVDLYAVLGEVWFGEFTPYPYGGTYPFRPLSFDQQLGEPWKLSTDRPLPVHENDL